MRKGLDLVKVRAVDETGALDVTFFNQAWLKNNLKQGETYVFFGKAEGNLLRRRMTNPVVEREGQGEFTGRIVPIYPLTAGVSQLILSRSVRQGLEECAAILPDVLPDEVRLGHASGAVYCAELAGRGGGSARRCGSGLPRAGITAAEHR